MLMKIRKKRFQAGVAVVYFSLVLSFLMGFFMLAANTGRLVYHKMRLQSSVDLAAYSGAAVQASYLGSDSENSIKRINAKIQGHYRKLLEEIQALTYPVAQSVTSQGFIGFGDPYTCSVACLSANSASLNDVLEYYRKASRDIQREHQKVRRILQQLPEKIRGAVEETMKINMPQFDLSGKLLGSTDSPATRELSEIMQPSALTQEELKNAILTFSSEQGAYLANVVSSVPHMVPYLNP
ncbi:MAG: TadE/TadG family type IV pilus assembly protein, partial [Bdellovibrionota bacterium]